MGFLVAKVGRNLMTTYEKPLFSKLKKKHLDMKKLLRLQLIEKMEKKFAVQTKVQGALGQLFDANAASSIYLLWLR